MSIKVIILLFGLIIDCESSPGIFSNAADKVVDTRTLKRVIVGNIQGRVPDKADHMLCRVQMAERLDKVQENVDADAVVGAYYKKDGEPCHTYCKIRSSDLKTSKITRKYYSPYYTICGTDRYCGKGGKCMAVHKILKLEDAMPEKQSLEGFEPDGSEQPALIPDQAAPAPAPDAPLPPSPQAAKARKFGR